MSVLLTEKVEFTRPRGAEITKRTTPNGAAVYIVRWRETDEEQESAVSDELQREWRFYDRADAEDLKRRLDTAEKRDRRKAPRKCPDCDRVLQPGESCSCGRGLENEETLRASSSPPKPIWTQAALDEARSQLPRGARAGGDIKRSLRVDTHGGDFAAHGEVGFDDFLNSGADPDRAGPAIGSTREWYRRFRPWHEPFKREQTFRNGARHQVEMTMNLEDWQRREARKTADTGQHRPAHQDFDTSFRRDRGATAPNGIVDLDSLPATTYVFGARRRIPAQTLDPSPEELRSAYAQQQREQSAAAAAEARRDRDAEAKCATPDCPNHGPLRKGLCPACWQFKRRNGHLPPPEVIRQRRWRAEAPVTT